jgi:hypothetical protein
MDTVLLSTSPNDVVLKKKKKKGVTRVAQATTSQLNPASEGHNQYEKGSHQYKPHP